MLKHYPTPILQHERWEPNDSLSLMLSGAGLCSTSGPTAAALLALKTFLWSACLRTAAVESGRPCGLQVGA